MAKYRQGKYVPRNPDKYMGNHNDIWYRSSWEWKVMDHFDRNPQVQKWSSETTVVPYLSPIDNKMHRYFIDFRAQIKNNSGEIKTYLIEVKPKAQTEPPRQGKKQTKRWLNEAATYCINQSKWEAAKTYARQRGYDFVVITEKELGLK